MNIAIIGAGVIGVSSAYYLQQQGHCVSIFDSLPGAGQETSYANAGLLTPSLCDPWNSPAIVWRLLQNLCSKDAPIRFNPRVIPSLLGWGMLFIRYSTAKNYFKNFEKNVQLANYSLQLLDKLEKELDFDFLYNKSGTLKIFRDAKSSAQLQTFIELSNKLNITSEWLNTRELIAKEPALAPIQNGLLGGVYYKNDAIGDAYLFTKNLARFLEMNQVDFFYNSTVQLINDRNSICSIEINKKRMEFDCIVLAAGSASAELALPLDIQLPIKPLKGYSITVDCKHWEIKPHIPVIDHELHVAITPLGDKLRVAGTAEFAGFNKTIIPERVKILKELLLKIYPHAAAYLNENAFSCWSGLRPTTVDGVPFISATQYKNSGLCS